MSQILVCLLLLAGIASPALAQDASRPVKVGVLTDFNSIAADLSGKGSVIAAHPANSCPSPGG